MGLNIKRAIKSRGLEVKEVASRMGITNIGLSQHINGNPSVEVLERIAKAIGCDVRDLFDIPETEGTKVICPKCGYEMKIKVE